MNGLGAFLVDASPGMMVLLKLTGLLGVGLVLNLMLLRMNPRWRVLMWRGVLVGTVVLCVGEVPAPKFLIAFEAVVEAPVAPDVEMSVVVDAFPAGPPEMFREQPDGLLESPGLGVDYGAEMSGDPMVERGDEALDSGTVYRIANPVWGLMAEHTWEVLYLGWLVVTSILLIRILIVAGRIRGIVHTARSAPREVLEAAESVSSELGCDVGFDVRVMRDLGSPFLVGIRRPIVVLPERMVEDDAGRDLSGVLAHELTHVRSNDVFWLLCNRIAASVLWFHPLVWIGLRSHGAACEDVCDAVAADYVGDREAYTGSLARTALLVAEGSVASGGLPMVRGSKITGRIRQIGRGIGAAVLSRKGAAGRVDSLRVPQAITGKPQGIPPWLRSRRDLYEGTLKRYSGAELRTRIGEAQQESDAIDRAGDGDTPSSPDFFQPVNDVNPHETPSHPTLTTPVDQGRHRGRFSIDTSPSSNLPLVESVGFGNGVYRVSYARRRDVPAPRQAQMPTWMQLS